MLEEITMTKGTVRLRVSRLLEERNLSIMDFSRIADIAPNTARGLARDAYDRIGVDTMTKICNALNVGPGELFAVEDQEE